MQPHESLPIGIFPETVDQAEHFDTTYAWMYQELVDSLKIMAFHACQIENWVSRGMPIFKENQELWPNMECLVILFTLFLCHIIYLAWTAFEYR